MNRKWIFIIEMDANVVINRFHEIVKDVRQNKGSILRATVEYVKILKKEQTRKRQIEDKCKIQEYQNRKLLLLLQV